MTGKGKDQEPVRLAQTLPKAVADRLAAMAAAGQVAEVGDPHTESPEQAAERRARAAVARSGRWLDALPTEYHEATLEDFDAAYVEPVQRWLADPRGLNLVLAGNTGAGKSRMAGALGNAALAAGMWCEWNRVSTLMHDLQGSPDNPQNPYLVERMVSRAPYAVFDDVPGGHVSPWAQERLTAILDARVANRRKTVWTTNTPEPALRAAWGDRLLDRMRDGMVVVQFTGPSWRKPLW